MTHNVLATAVFGVLTVGEILARALVVGYVATFLIEHWNDR